MGPLRALFYIAGYFFKGFTTVFLKVKYNVWEK